MKTKTRKRRMGLAARIRAYNKVWARAQRAARWAAVQNAARTMVVGVRR